jgi:Zn-dependent protease with chaperone function/Zn-finger nucleic acid-binding protein
MNIKKKDDFFEIQEKQKRLTYLLFFLLIGIYFVLIGVFYFFVRLILFQGFFGGSLFSSWHLGVIFALASGSALYQWYDARNNGSDFILNHLNAKKPDRNDLYHKRLLNIIEEMRISAGYKKLIKTYVIPANAVNCLALTDRDGSAIIGMTEGAIARFTREELQAAVAHEVSHIIRGDALFVTFACSLGNVFQKIADIFQSGGNSSGRGIFSGTGVSFSYRWEGGQVLAARFGGMMTSSVLSLITRSISLLISREREYLADATAVELTRNPEALAKAILKAHKHYSFIGSAGETYSPIFIISPQSRGAVTEEKFMETISGTHPPTIKRIKKITSMTGKSILQLYRVLEKEEEGREKAREEIKSIEEKKQALPGFAKSMITASVISRIEKMDQNPEVVVDSTDEKIMYQIKEKGGCWSESHDIKGLFAIPLFTGMSTLRIAGTAMEGLARSFPDILKAFKNPDCRGIKRGHCPQCGAQLIETHYEGVPIRICIRCGGRLVPRDGIMRIIARRELKPSEYLIKKALDFRRDNQVNPTAIKRRKKELQEKESLYHCPECGYAMMRINFSYQYFVEIDDCRNCDLIWFDGDELEILQVLIEDVGY